jgi:hypothetical protein
MRARGVGKAIRNVPYAIRGVVSCRRTPGVAANQLLVSDAASLHLYRLSLLTRV